MTISINLQTNLYIHSVEIENFRQYYGKHKIVFSTNPKKNFTIIRGGNGFGKTNFLNAIYWCLYRKDIKNDNNKRLPIFSLEAIEKTPISKLLQTSVSINLGTEEKITYIITRKMTARKESNSQETYSSHFGQMNKGLVELTEIASFSKWSELDKAWIDFYDDDKTKEFTREVDNFLPEVLSEFVFFDGEKLENFFNFQQHKQSRIKTALENISQLPLLDDLIKHLETVEDKFLERSKEIGGQNSKTLAELIEQHKATIEKYNISIKDNDDKLIDAKTKLENINNQLIDLKIEEITKKIKQQREYEIAKERINESIKKLYENKNQIILSNFAIILLNEAISKTIDIINENVRSGKMPPPVDQQTCIDILKNNECICGTNILEDLNAKMKIEDLLKRANLEPLQDTTTDLYQNLNEYLNLDTIKNQIVSITSSISGDENKLSTIENYLKDISIHISGYDEPEVKNLHDIKNSLSEEIESRVSSKSIEEHKKEEIEKLLSKVRFNYTVTLQREKKTSILSKKIKSCQRIMEILKNIKSDLINEFRELVEKDTKETFFKLIYKQHSFQDVKIEKDYSISVILRKYESVGSLSAGESLFLAISFISALKKIAGVRMPLILDSPLGKIDGPPRILCAQYLPIYSQKLGIQITMLLTGSEYDSRQTNDGKEIESFREVILPYVEKEYQMVFDEDKQKVEIKNYV